MRDNVHQKKLKKIRVLTYFSEGRQLLPAGDQGAGTGDSMAFAGHFRSLYDRLEREYVYGNWIPEGIYETGRINFTIYY